MPGYKVPLDDMAAVNENFICPSCGLLLRDAVQTCCGHIYCEHCLDNIQRLDDPKCLKSTCKESFIQAESFADGFVRREILNLTVTCLHKDGGCDWHGSLRAAEEHYENCPHILTRCTNHGCNDLVPACNLEAHREACPHSQVQCIYCNSQQTVGSIMDHFQTCPDALLNCDTCGRQIPRNQMESHTDATNGNCPRKYCPFRQRGCEHDELMDQATLDNHLVDGLSTHLLLLQRFVETKFIPKNEECCCSTTNSNLRQFRIAAEARLEAHEWTLKTDYRLFTEVKEDTRTLFHALVQVGERVQNVEATNVALRQEVAELKGRIEAVENQAERRDNRVNDQLDFTRASCGSLSRSVQELHRRNEVHSYNGELVWIIPDVRPKWVEARNNPDSFLSSPPFYTSPSGYKARIDLYLNGRGQDWALNMSFFLVIMKGEYDPVCTWPFDHHVQFSLMGQGASTGNDVIVHLQPNPRDPAFARPVAGRNFPDDAQAHCVIPLTNLRSQAYVDDDTLFVKVIVREK